MAATRAEVEARRRARVFSDAGVEGEAVSRRREAKKLEQKEGVWACKSEWVVGLQSKVRASRGGKCSVRRQRPRALDEVERRLRGARADLGWARA
jgi:hypothetical protein